MPPDVHSNDHDLLAWEADSGPQWLGGAIAVLLWLIAAAFWRHDPLIAGFGLLIASVVAVTGALLARLSNLAATARKAAPWLSAAAFTLIATKLAIY